MSLFVFFFVLSPYIELFLFMIMGAVHEAAEFKKEVPRYSFSLYFPSAIF
jgi:hypothetical protein